MKQSLTHDRDVVIMDCDGVWYSWGIFGDMEGAKNFCADVKAAVVPLLLPSLSPADVRILGRQSYEQTGDGLRFFIDRAKKAGMDPETFRHDLSTLYHQEQYRRIKQDYPEVAAPCPRTLNAMRQLEPRIQYGMLSQSCRDNWLEPLMNDWGIRPFFRPEHTFGFREFGWHEKSQSARGLGILMETMGVEPSRVIFVEDTHRNLAPVKESYEEVLTVHLYDYNPPTEADHIDLSFGTRADFFDAMVGVHLAPAPGRTTEPRFQPQGLHL